MRPFAVRRMIFLPLVLLLIACRPAAPGLVPPPSPTPTLTVGETITPEGPAFAARLTLTASATQIRVGESLWVTATLRNEGWALIGLPLYRLQIDQPVDQPSLEPAAPEPIEHHLGLGQGESDAATFTLQAVRPGHARLWASVSIEVHEGFPGPAYWSHAGSQRLEVEVVP